MTIQCLLRTNNCIHLILVVWSTFLIKFLVHIFVKQLAGASGCRIFLFSGFQLLFCCCFFDNDNCTCMKKTFNHDQ